MKHTPTPTEHLFCFASWLTTREESLVLGANHDAAPIVELLGQYLDRQGLPDVTDRYPDGLQPIGQNEK